MKTISTAKSTARVLKPMVAFVFICMLALSGRAQQGWVEDIKYYSATQDDTCHMNIYFPPGYDDEADTNHYPVFYLVHGYGENYTHWKNYGRADTVLNYYINHDQAVPMILVMPDGRNLPPEVYSSEVLNDIIPYVESNYRAKTDKDSRGIGGLSWGGQQSLKTGILNYQMFGYMAILSSGYFSADLFNEAEAFLDTNGAKVEESLRYFYFAQGTSFDLTYESGMQALAMFREKGLTVHYWEYSGGHQWTVWKEDFKSFAPYLFRDSTTRYISLVFQGGTIKNSTVMTHRDSLAPRPADPVRTGYTFTGWFLQPECIDSFNFATDTVRKNMTIYANWSINSYTVSFVSNGGDYTPDPIVAVYRSLITEPTPPQKEGYEFGGWFSDEELTTQWVFESFRVSGDMTLYAKWVVPDGLSSRQESRVIIFPNPANTYVQLENLPEDCHIAIYSMEGRLMMQLTPGTADVTVDLSQLNAGMYVMDIHSPTQNLRHRLMKE